MYTYSYGTSIVSTVKLTVETLGYDFDSYNWMPSAYYAALFFLSLVGTPLFLLLMLTEDKWDTVKMASRAIIERHFDFEK